MPHPKSMYKMTSDGMQEKFAMSQDEEWSLSSKEWHDHPETARINYREIEEAVEPVPFVDFNDMTKKELDAHGRTLGLALDLRTKKETLIQQIMDAT